MDKPKRLDLIFFAILAIVTICSMISAVVGVANNRKIARIDQRNIELATINDSLDLRNAQLRAEAIDMMRTINSQDEYLRELRDERKIKLTNEKIIQRHNAMPFDSALVIFEGRYGKTVLR